MAFLETPSRILRRMEALEAQDYDLPSLPSMPAFEDSSLHSLSSNGSLSPDALRNGDDDGEVDAPFQSTPAPASSHTTRSTMRPPPSTSSSATRFANSMRASVSSAIKSQVEPEESFEVSQILPAQHDSDGSSTAASIPDIYLPPETSEDLTDFQRQNDDAEAFAGSSHTEGRSDQGSLHESVEEDQSEPEHRDSSGSPGTRTPFPKAFSSPAPSPLRDLHSPNSPIDVTPVPARSPTEAPQDFATPYSRRRSFLLSLVHSTTRPRMAFPTPHPKTRTAPTPRPRAHPLSQAWTPSPAHFAREAPSSGSSLSPHDRLSFISTASSHDLTVHPRANASFDPVTGSKGAGRFNAVKLNTYLHGLNRRLQEENEMLVGRLRMHGEEVELGKVAEELEREGFKGVEEAVLQEVEEMRNELERSEQEKADIIAERDALSGQVESLERDEEEIKNELQSEREERKKDKERWKSRMAEVESGIEGVIKELERRLEEAERAAQGKVEAEEEARQLKERYAAFQDDLDIANLRAEKAEDALASSSDMGAEIKKANDLAAVCREEARAATERAQDLELRLRDAERREAGIKITLEDQITELEEELRHSLEAQQSAEAHAIELEAEAKDADDHIEELEEQLTTARERAAELLSENSQLQAQMSRLNEDSARAVATAQQMEDALEESERKMISDEETLAMLQAKVNRLERELETRRERSKSLVLPDSGLSRSHNLEAEQLEAELDDAHKEIAKLNHLLLQSPSRKAVEKAKDMRIELLERDKAELSERVRALRLMMSSPSPSKTASSAINTPLTHRQILALKSPITPGGPLKDYSWLHGNTTVPTPGPLVAQIEHLRQELNLANDSIDEKVDKIEEAGIDIVGLTRSLEDARARIIALEEEIGRLTRREERESLAADQAGFERRYVDASAHINRLRQELASSQKLHDERRHQLDQRVAEVEELRRELAQRAQELERIELEKKKARSDRNGIVKDVASLESDLRRVRSDAEALGRDLKQLKNERDRLETKHRDELGRVDRAHKQLHSQIRIANEQLEAQREKTNKAITDLEGHVCELNKEGVEKLHRQHKNECKGLLVQIRYLKAKFTRESLFRSDLGYQKHYLLNILGSFEKSEKQILAAVARIGFPSQPVPARKRRTLRAIAVAALFISKARRASEAWREQSASKSAVAAALQDVRRRRITGSLGYI